MRDGAPVPTSQIMAIPSLPPAGIGDDHAHIGDDHAHMPYARLKGVARDEAWEAWETWAKGLGTRA